MAFELIKIITHDQIKPTSSFTFSIKRLNPSPD
jgi:hypothetical protein